MKKSSAVLKKESQHEGVSKPVLILWGGENARTGTEFLEAWMSHQSDSMAVGRVEAMGLPLAR